MAWWLQLCTKPWTRDTRHVLQRHRTEQHRRPGALQRQRKRRCFRDGTQPRGKPGFHVAGSELVGAKCRLSIHTVYERTVSTAESLFNSTTSSVGNTNVVWENGLSDLEFNMVFTPLPNLVLSPGIRLSKSDIETRENGVVDGARTQRAKHARPEFRFGYKPWSKLSFRGDLHSSTSGASYTAITPHTRVAGHLIARFELLANLSIENALTVSTARLEETDYRNQVRANTTTISYALDERFSVFGSFGYDSFYAQGELSTLGAPPP